MFEFYLFVIALKTRSVAEWQLLAIPDCQDSLIQAGSSRGVSPSNIKILYFGLTPVLDCQPRQRRGGNDDGF